MEKQRDRLKAFRKRKKAEREVANKPKTTKPKAETSQVRAMSKPGVGSGSGTRKPVAKKPAAKPVAKKPAAKPAASKPAASKPKPTKGQTERFFSSSSKGSVNKQQGMSNFFRSSSGTRGSNVPSNPKLKTQPKKKPKKNRRGRTVKRKDDYRLF